MCSNTHCASRSPWMTGFISSPPAVSETISPGWTSDHLCADDVEGAALRGDHEAFVESIAGLDLAQRQRAHAVRIAKRHDGVLGHHDGRVGALEPRHDLGDGV